MKIFGLDITRASKAMNPVPMMRNGWRVISESYAGAWQQNVTETQGNLLCYPTLYACVSRIATDVGKLPYLLMQESENGIWKSTQNPSYSPVLRKPNGFQTAQQFRESWLISKITQGNTYVLKRRDNRGVVIAMYVLDPCRVQPMVTDSGAVYYQLQTDALNTLPHGYPADNLIVPAREIIHDRCITLHHPLIGIPPLCAAYWPALKNLKILKSAANFFTNNAQPGGILTAPAGMSDDDAKRVQEYWAANYTEENSGKVAVIGADMEFTSFAQNGADSQLVEQMRYSDEQICQPFGIPPFKIGIGSIPAGLGVDAINQLYYADALQSHIEAMEALLDEGLNISRPLGVELDLEPLLRMDVGKQADVATKLVGGGIETPNEGRFRFNLPPLLGGDTVYMQQQDYPLDQVRLNKIEAPVPPPADPEPVEPPEPDEETQRMLAELFQFKALAAARAEAIL